MQNTSSQQQVLRQRDQALRIIRLLGWEDLDIEYLLVFQQNVNLMLAHCLRRWLNNNKNLTHVRRMWRVR